MAFFTSLPYASGMSVKWKLRCEETLWSVQCVQVGS